MDTLVIWLLVDYQKDSARHDSLNAVEYYLTSTVEDAAGAAQNIYLNKYINSFLNTDFLSPLEYYNDYLKLMADSLYLTAIPIRIESNQQRKTRRQYHEEKWRQKREGQQHPEQKGNEP